MRVAAIRRDESPYCGHFSHTLCYFADDVAMHRVHLTCSVSGLCIYVMYAKDKQSTFPSREQR